MTSVWPPVIYPHIHDKCLTPGHLPTYPWQVFDPRLSTHIPMTNVWPPVIYPHTHDKCLTPGYLPTYPWQMFDPPVIYPHTHDKRLTPGYLPTYQWQVKHVEMNEDIIQLINDNLKYRLQNPWVIPPPPPPHTTTHTFSVIDASNCLRYRAYLRDFLAKTKLEWQELDIEI